jgi:hypothetical protein
MSGIKIHPAILIAAGLLILFLAIDNNDKKKRLAALQREIDRQQALGKQVRQMLHDLVEQNKSVDPALANELTQIITLLNIKQDATALMKLAKVIENLLLELYGKDEELKAKVKADNRKKAVFADYLEHAKAKGLIGKEDYHLIAVLKEIRNEEAHTLGVVKEVTRAAAALVAGIGVIFTLCKLLKRTSVAPAAI